MTGPTDWTEQARRVVAGLSGILGGGFGGAAPSGTAAEPGPGAAAASDCRWCPVCQTAAMLRGERPELSAAMADVLATAAEALRSVAAQGTAEAPVGEPAAEQPAADQPATDRPATDQPAADRPAADHSAPGHARAGADEARADPDLVDLEEPPAPGHEGPAVQRIEIG